MDNLEKKIIQKLKEKDEHTFKFVFNKYYPALYYYAKKITKDKMNAEEAVQMTFLKLWEKPEKINIEKSLNAYLFKAVHNNCINILRKLQIKNKYNDNYKKLIVEANESNQISKEDGYIIFMANELKEKIEKNINDLPKQCQRIFKLSRYDGLKNQEIADKLKISINSVTKQISIALSRLRESLSLYLPDNNK